jgi:hypothetical protein
VAVPVRISPFSRDSQLAFRSIGGQEIFSWSPALDTDDTHSLTGCPSHRRSVYTLTVVSACGFPSNGDRKSVWDILFPVRFPNGDGLNDTWNIPALAAYSTFEVTVYNRWGQPVFQAKNIGPGMEQ